MKTFGWLGPGAQSLVEALVERGVPQDALQEALRLAYWGAQRSLIPRVEATQRKAMTRHVARLARLEEHIADVLDRGGLSGKTNGDLRAAQASLRREGRVQAPTPARRGRPTGWRLEAQKNLAALDIRQAEARRFHIAIARLVASRPLAPHEVQYVRVAFRQPERTRKVLLLRFPIPPRFRRS